jgi:hypothetical protein
VYAATNVKLGVDVAGFQHRGEKVKQDGDDEDSVANGGNDRA